MSVSAPASVPDADGAARVEYLDHLAVATPPAQERRTGVPVAVAAQREPLDAVRSACPPSRQLRVVAGFEAAEAAQHVRDSREDAVRDPAGTRVGDEMPQFCPGQPVATAQPDGVAVRRLVREG